MPLTPSLVVIAGLSLVLAIVSALAGLGWAKLRSMPLVHAAHLARQLAERQQALEELIERLERTAKRGREAVPLAAHPTGPPPVTASRRIDVPQPSAYTGPTLIAVPDLSAPPPDAPSKAGDELASRFGAIWQMAAQGVSSEEIARQSGQPIGQVELILGLRRQLAANAEGRP